MYFQIVRQNVPEQADADFQDPFIKIKIRRMEAILKAFAWIMAADPHHYPPPFLAKVSKIFGTHSWKSAVDIIGTQDVAGAGHNVIYQYGLIYQNRISLCNVQCC